jgi:type 1 glutamine amidotransferase
MEPFETTDELYYNQQGDEPIQILATARRQDTGHDEPMAFVYGYGQGRVFQTVLGHDAASLRTAGTAELVRRGTAWAAGR